MKDETIIILIAAILYLAVVAGLFVDYLGEKRGFNRGTELIQQELDICKQNREFYFNKAIQYRSLLNNK